MIKYILKFFIDKKYSYFKGIEKMKIIHNSFINFFYLKICNFYK